MTFQFAGFGGCFADFTAIDVQPSCWFMGVDIG